MFSVRAWLAPSDPTRWCVWRPPRWSVWVPATLERRPSAVACWGPRPQAPRQAALRLWDSPPPGAAGLGAPETPPRAAASCRPASGGFPATWKRKWDLLPGSKNKPLCGWTWSHDLTWLASPVKRALVMLRRLTDPSTLQYMSFMPISLHRVMTARWQCSP